MHGLSSRVSAARDEGGFTMVAAMGVMLIVMALSVVAFAAANGDMRVNSRNQAQRQAYSAAEAGIADFLYQLSRDPDVWTRCDTDATDPKVGETKISQAWNGVGTDPRVWRQIDGTHASYALEPIAADGYSTCDPAVPASMQNPDTGTFTIRATGKVMDGGKEVKRSVLATFKRKNFLDYIYFTDVEAQDPILWAKLMGCTGSTPSSETSPACAQVEPGHKTLETWAAENCTKYWRNGRGSAAYSGEVRWGGSGGYDPYPVRCTEITFFSGENIKGPFHTNDSILVNGNPTFGRRASDVVEISAKDTTAEQAWRPKTESPNWLGTRKFGAPTLDPPPTNASLKKDATLSFDGPTRIALNSNGTMTVTNRKRYPSAPHQATIQQPKSGVIYVGTEGSCTPYDPFVPKVAAGTETAGCGDIAISGTYTQNLTFAADNDLVVTDDLRKSANHDVVLGLIANNFVRVAHPSRFDAWSGNASWSNGLGWPYYRQGPKCVTTSDATTNIYIDAAILALNHSFTVDRYGCGSDLGDLHVHGAISQKHRGVVGMGGGSGGTGFTKQYTYDDRLRFRTPPKFLDPVNTAWAVARQVEQSPAT